MQKIQNKKVFLSCVFTEIMEGFLPINDFLIERRRFVDYVAEEVENENKPNFFGIKKNSINLLKENFESIFGKRIARDLLRTNFSDEEEHNDYFPMSIPYRVHSILKSAKNPYSSATEFKKSFMRILGEIYGNENGVKIAECYIKIEDRSHIFLSTLLNPHIASIVISAELNRNNIEHLFGFSPLSQIRSMADLFGKIFTSYENGSYLLEIKSNFLDFLKQETHEDERKFLSERKGNISRLGERAFFQPKILDFINIADTKDKIKMFLVEDICARVYGSSLSTEEIYIILLRSRQKQKEIKEHIKNERKDDNGRKINVHKITNFFINHLGKDNGRSAFEEVLIKSNITNLAEAEERDIEKFRKIAIGEYFSKYMGMKKLKILNEKFKNMIRI